MTTQPYTYGRGQIQTCRWTDSERAAVRALKDLRKSESEVISLDELLSRIEERLNVKEHLFCSFVLKGVYYDFHQFMCSVSFKSYEIGRAEYSFSPIGVMVPESRWMEHLTKCVTSFVDFYSKS